MFNLKSTLILISTPSTFFVCVMQYISSIAELETGCFFHIFTIAELINVMNAAIWMYYWPLAWCADKIGAEIKGGT